MKRILLAMIVALTLSFSISSCKKSTDVQHDSNKEITTSKDNDTRAQRLSTGDRLNSNYGYLVFSSYTSIENFRQFILSNTHATVQTYLDSIGFNSLGESKYGSGYQNSIVTEDQAPDYMMNQDYIFGVESLLFRPVSFNEECETPSFSFLLVMYDNYLNSGTYSDLANGTFDSQNMNKFATNPDLQTSSISEFMQTTLYGHEDESPNECGDLETDKFWGWTDYDCVEAGIELDPSDNVYKMKYKRTKYKYMFWIIVKKDSYFSYGCLD